MNPFEPLEPGTSSGRPISAKCRPYDRSVRGIDRRFGGSVLGFALLTAFVAVSLPGLGSFPLVHEDEPWQAASGWGFFSTGRFSSELFAGFAGREIHDYGFLPLFPLLVGGSLKLLGPSLFAARLVSLVLVTLALVVTFRLATSLLSPRHGLVALGFLVLLPIAAPMAHLSTGIPLADAARIARYDSAVPLFGLLALLVAAPVLLDRSASKLRPVFAGALTGLATLSHAYGVGWLLVLFVGCLLLGKRGRRLRDGLLVTAGFLAVLSPYLLYVASGLPDFLAQTRNYGERFDLLSPGFYAGNLLAEPRRWGSLARGLLSGRPAPWVFLLGLCTGTFALWRKAATIGGERLLLLTTAVFPLVFALLLQQKNPLYLTTLHPLLAVVAAAGAIEAWDRWNSRLARSLFAALLVLAFGDGLAAWRRLHIEAGRATPYANVTRALASRIPTGSLVTGLPHWWLGFANEPFQYRAILVPVFLSNPKYVADPVPMEVAMAQLAPDVVILDPRLRDWLARSGERGDRTAVGLQRYLVERRKAVLLALDDPSYGRLEVVALSRPGSQPAAAP